VESEATYFSAHFRVTVTTSRLKMIEKPDPIPHFSGYDNTKPRGSKGAFYTRVRIRGRRRSERLLSIWRGKGFPSRGFVNVEVLIRPFKPVSGLAGTRFGSGLRRTVDALCGGSVPACWKAAMDNRAELPQIEAPCYVSRMLRAVPGRGLWLQGYWYRVFL
jgi:hypothetical protein